MPGTIKIGNEGFRAVLETDSNNDLVIKNVNGQQMIVKPEAINFFSGSSTHNQIIFEQSKQAASIYVSGTNPQFNISETDRNAHATFQSSTLLFVSRSIGWTQGINNDCNYQIQPWKLFDSTTSPRILFVSGSGTVPNGELQMTGSVLITGSLTLNGSDVGSGGSSDNLGNHTATQDLDLDGNSIKDALHITASGNISASKDITLGHTTKYSG